MRTHPVIGRKSLFCSTLAAGIAGWSPVSSCYLLQKLREHVDLPHLYYIHDWRVGDVVMWDNRCTNHKRTPDRPR